MKHMLRKYLSNRGSALFMVVSTMAALILMVTAMYMSVISSRQVQYSVFNQEQAYVTSASINDMVYTYICQNRSSKLASSVFGLKKGQSVSTNGNDFKAFGGTTKEDHERLGAFDVNITYVYDVGDDSYYDIAVTVENNGVYETTHNYMIISGEMPKMRRIDNFFTATGYLPTDVWIQRTLTDSTMYFDNEYVRFSELSVGSVSNKEMSYNFNITALGSLEISLATSNVPNEKAPKPEAPLKWVIGKDFTISTNRTSGWTNIDFFGTAQKPGRLIVGGDMHFYLGESGRSIAENTEIWVLGDLYITGGGNSIVQGSGKIYVNGNIYDTADYSESSRRPKENMIYGSSGSTYNYKSEPPKAMKEWDNESYNEVLDQFNNAMNPSVWPKWEVKSTLEEFDVKFTKENNSTVYISKDVLLRNYGYDEDSTKNNLCYLIVDTGDDPTGVRTIRLSPNMETTDVNDPTKKVKKVFSWAPWDNGKVLVLTVGKGSLVIDVPEGVIYQDSKRGMTGNIAWYTMLGGRVEYDSANSRLKFSGFDTSAVKSFTSHGAYDGLIIADGDVKKYDPLMSESANLSAGACVYEEKVIKETVDGVETVKTKYLTCKTHGGWYDYDDKEYTTCQEITDYYAGETDSLCVGRINADAIDTYYGTTEGSAALTSLETFYDNYSAVVPDGTNFTETIKYPNVNVFMVSCSENAQIYMGKSQYAVGGEIDENVLFGYIYAPYMTYQIDGGGHSPTYLRCLGGLVVSDIIMGSDAKFLFAQPDISIPGLVGPDWRDNILSAQTDKSWRITHGGT